MQLISNFVETRRKSRAREIWSKCVVFRNVMDHHNAFAERPHEQSIPIRFSPLFQISLLLYFVSSINPLA